MLCDSLTKLPKGSHTIYRKSQTFERGSVGTKRFPLPDSLHRAAVLRSVKPPVYQKLEASVVANGI